MNVRRLLSRVLTPLLVVAASVPASGAQPLNIGSRLELFVDTALVERMTGDVQLRLHKPTPQEVVLVTDKPWEGNTSAYYTIFQDGPLYRMYYRGSHFDEKTRKGTHAEVTCYAESQDGIHWTKPKLGLFEFDGSKQNNIVWTGIGTHCFTPFKDDNPDCSAEARYKALSRGRPKGKRGLYAFKSPDGIHWSLMAPEPVITTGAFDSQNLGFWDPHTCLYREYHRTFHNGVRAIMTGTSSDFVKWSEPVLLEYPDAPNEHLYTNAILSYDRAPHILIGFPTRFLPKEASRVEPVFMASRDGRTFHRWAEAVIPEDAPQDRNGNRSNYMTWGLLQLPSNDRECSVYATEAYYTGPDSRVRRFTYRVDGFVSAQASSKGGQLLTKPIVFAGSKLVVNFATAAEGSLRVEVQNADGQPISGLRLTDCPAQRGDSVKHTVTWKQHGNLASAASQPVRLLFELRDADLFSFQVVP